jgi:hypothetical protein
MFDAMTNERLRRLQIARNARRLYQSRGDDGDNTGLYVAIAVIAIAVLVVMEIFYG